MHQPQKPHLNNCQNCGIKDDLEVFDHVHGGIVLCQDCADMPLWSVRKRNSSVNWVKVDGEYFPPELPVVKRNK